MSTGFSNFFQFVVSVIFNDCLINFTDHPLANVSVPNGTRTKHCLILLVNPFSHLFSPSACIRGKRAPPCDFRRKAGHRFGDNLLSHGLYPHYHWPDSVSRPSSGWDRVVPLLYDHQKLVGLWGWGAFFSAATGHHIWDDLKFSRFKYQKERSVL